MSIVDEACAAMSQAAAEIERLRAREAELLAALEDVIAINDESAGDCRKRMGTRRGNSIVVARDAIARGRGL